MKLGTQTGSLVNRLYSRATIGQPKPKVGMGATVLGWTDRTACTITKVWELCSKNWLWEIEVVADITKVVSGSEHDGSAVYEHAPDTRFDASPSMFRFNRKTQSWVAGFMSKETGKFNAYKGKSGIRIGERDHYRDPSF